MKGAAIAIGVVGLMSMLVSVDPVRSDSRHMGWVQLRRLTTALEAYKLDTGTYPTTEQGLAALYKRPPLVEHWAGPYLPGEARNDPWGHPYIYRFPGEHGPDPDVASLGADGRPGGTGNDADIVSWKD